jgi:hypothetical protein
MNDEGEWILEMHVSRRRSIIFSRPAPAHLLLAVGASVPSKLVSSVQEQSLAWTLSL